VDELVEKSELTSSEVLVALCEMEMKESVRQMPGKHSSRFCCSPRPDEAGMPSRTSDAGPFWTAQRKPSPGQTGTSYSTRIENDTSLI